MWSTRIGEPKPSATSQPPRRGVGARWTAATSNAGVAKARLSRSLGRSMLAINRASGRVSASSSMRTWVVLPRARLLAVYVQRRSWSSGRVRTIASCDGGALEGVGGEGVGVLDVAGVEVGARDAQAAAVVGARLEALEGGVGVGDGGAGAVVEVEGAVVAAADDAVAALERAGWRLSTAGPASSPSARSVARTAVLSCWRSPLVRQIRATRWAPCWSAATRQRAAASAVAVVSLGARSNT